MLTSIHRRVQFLLLALLAVCWGCDSSSPVAAEPETISPSLDRVTADDEDDWEENRGRFRVEFADLAIFLEFNSTDDDLGVQVALDAEGWDRVRATDPDGRRVLEFVAKRQFGDLGLTELRFESAEPSPAEVLGAIPPGDYLFTGRTVEGFRLEGVAELSHDLLGAPVFTPDDGDIVDPASTVIEWDPVPGAVEYEIIVVNEDSGHELTATLDEDATELPIPAAFMEPDSEYKVEVLAIAENGNKTITEHVFGTSG